MRKHQHRQLAPTHLIIVIAGIVPAVGGHGSMITNGVSKHDLVADGLAVAIEVDERVRGLRQTDAAVVERYLDTTGMARTIVAIAYERVLSVAGAVVEQIGLP
jgi:hypothetical protein